LLKNSNLDPSIGAMQEIISRRNSIESVERERRDSKIGETISKENLIEEDDKDKTMGKHHSMKRRKSQGQVAAEELLVKKKL
jgi:hypothetical protein